MATWDEVDAIASELPEVTSRVGGHDAMRQWQVRKKTFVWERPLRKSDLEALGGAAPDGPILGAWLADEGEKFALIEGNPGVYFTTPHFSGYAAVLVNLDAIGSGELAELITDAWLNRAPKRVASEFLSSAD
ncbi:MAG: hypothetical protein WA988_09800 [Candidatus Nanopelagicales bacterium]